MWVSQSTRCSNDHVKISTNVGNNILKFYQRWYKTDTVHRYPPPLPQVKQGAAECFQLNASGSQVQVAGLMPGNHFGGARFTSADAQPSITGQDPESCTVKAAPGKPLRLLRLSVEIFEVSPQPHAQPSAHPHPAVNTRALTDTALTALPNFRR